MEGIFTTEITPESIKEVQEQKTIRKNKERLKLIENIEKFVKDDEQLPKKKIEKEEPISFKDIEETLVKNLLKDIKPGEKRLIGRISDEIKKAPNLRRLKQISLAIGILGIATLGITGYILLNRLLGDKTDKLSK